MKTKMPLRKKLLIGGIAGGFTIILLASTYIYLTFFMPLPFTDNLWADYALRHRATDDISQIVIGLHEEDIILMLREPDDSMSGSSYRVFIAYRIRDKNHHWFWQHLIIFLDENGIAIGTTIVNPAHIS